MVMKFLDRLAQHLRGMDEQIRAKQMEMEALTAEATHDLRKDYDDLQERLDTLEAEIDDVENEVTENPAYQYLKEELEALVDEKRRLEDYAKQNNVQVST